MREGLVTEADIALLPTRNVEAPIKVPSLFAYHEPKNAHNHKVMQQHVGQEIHLHALHKIVARMLPQGRATLLERAKQVLWAEDLASCIILKVGLPVEVFKNVRTADGLVNGASGTFRGKTGEGMCSLAWVEFDDEKVGADTRAAAIVLMVPTHLAGCTPIKLWIASMKVGRHPITRFQFPLNLAVPSTTRKAPLSPRSRSTSKRPPSAPITHPARLCTMSRCPETQLETTYLKSFDYAEFGRPGGGQRDGPAENIGKIGTRDTRVPSSKTFINKMEDLGLTLSDTGYTTRQRSRMDFCHNPTRGVPHRLFLPQ
jgi:hypothetical protein